MRPFGQEPIPTGEEIKNMFEKLVTDNFIGYSRIDGYPMFECNTEFHRNYHVWRDYFDTVYIKQMNDHLVPNINSPFFINEDNNNDIDNKPCIKVMDMRDDLKRVVRERKLNRIIN